MNNKNFVTLPMTQKDIQQYNKKNINEIAHKKKLLKYNNIDNFLSHNETQIIDLHDILLDKYTNIGYLNKSKIQNFIELIINNSILKEIKRYPDDINIQDDIDVDDVTEYNNEIMNDYYF
jgi:hypothetical protein